MNGLCLNDYCYLEDGSVVAQLDCQEATTCSVSKTSTQYGHCSSTTCIWGDLVDTHNEVTRVLYFNHYFKLN